MKNAIVINQIGDTLNAGDLIAYCDTDRQRSEEVMCQIFTNLEDVPMIYVATHAGANIEPYFYDTNGMIAQLNIDGNDKKYTVCDIIRNAEQMRTKWGIDRNQAIEIIIDDGLNLIPGDGKTGLKTAEAGLTSIAKMLNAIIVICYPYHRSMGIFTVQTDKNIYDIYNTADRLYYVESGDKLDARKNTWVQTQIMTETNMHKKGSEAFYMIGDHDKAVLYNKGDKWEIIPTGLAIIRGYRDAHNMIRQKAQHLLNACLSTDDTDDIAQTAGEIKKIAEAIPKYDREEW